MTCFIIIVFVFVLKNAIHGVVYRIMEYFDSFYFVSKVNISNSVTFIIKE